MFIKELLNRFRHVIMANKHSIISMHDNHFRDCLCSCREGAPVEISLQLTSVSFLGFTVQDRMYGARVRRAGNHNGLGGEGGRYDRLPLLVDRAHIQVKDPSNRVP